jgi:hypothetical protein
MFWRMVSVCAPPQGTNFRLESRLLRSGLFGLPVSAEKCRDGHACSDRRDLIALEKLYPKKLLNFWGIINILNSITIKASPLDSFISEPERHIIRAPRVSVKALTADESKAEEIFYFSKRLNP